MPKCKACGADLPNPEKTWTMAPKGKPPVTMGLFRCPSCGKYSRLKA